MRHLASHDRHYLAWLSTYHPNGAELWQACYGLSEKGVLPSYHQGALDRLVDEGWLCRTFGRVTRYHLTSTARAEFSLPRKCGHKPCYRYFIPSDDEGNQRYCRPECAKHAYKARCEERNPTEPNKENPVSSLTTPQVARADLALKVMRDETCATLEQQDRFRELVLGHIPHWKNDTEANRDIALLARNVARPDQMDELNALLVKRGFEAPPPPKNQTMRIVLDIEVSGHPIEHADPSTSHTYDHGLVGQVLTAVKAIPESSFAPGRKIVHASWQKYLFNPSSAAPALK